jgi:hypothetical protein
MFDTEDVGVFLGLDVGRTTHHGHGLTPAGKKIHNKPLPNSEPKLRAVFDNLAAKFGTVLVIVDQPASIGALPLTVARDAGCKVAYLPGLAMLRIADLYPGEAKTDTKDAAVIADAARTMPHTLRSLEPTDEITAELTGFGQVGNAFIRVVNQAGGQEIARYDLSEDASTETAMVFGELYRHGAEWKFRAVGQGYASGLAGIGADFGVNV